MSTESMALEGGSRPPVRALVVDDHENVARTVARCLERDGVRCDIALSAAHALEWAERHTYDMVFADVHMPGESGLELVRRLKARDATIQVVMMTGSTVLDNAIEALRADADDYLLKPFHPTELTHAAHRAADHRRLLLENRDYRETLESRVREQAGRLESLYVSGIQSLVTALEAKDPHTRGHSERVAVYAAALGELHGGVDLDALRVGARLHDIGKIGIRHEVLWKDGPLSLEEAGHVRAHPAIGEQILRPMLEEDPVLQIVRHHHERWDGAGYPDGLAGADIPLMARIVSVADTFDAMTTIRPYRAALTPDRVIAEVEAEAGRQFDPVLATLAREAFIGSMKAAS